MTVGRKYKTPNLVNNRSLKRNKRIKSVAKAKKIKTKTHHDGVGGGSGSPKKFVKKPGRGFRR